MQKSLSLIVIVAAILTGNCELRAEIVNSAETPSIGKEILSKEIRTAIEDGKLLESAHQWNDAKSFYEKTLRAYPGNLEIQSKYSRTKIMCDIQGRFANSGYVPQLAAMDVTALRNVVERILRVQVNNFAYPMTFQEMYYRELCGLSVALTSETFQEFVIPQATTETIQTFRKFIVQESETRKIADFNDLVSATCQLGARASRTFHVKESFFTLEAVCGLISGLDQYSVVLLQPQYQGILSSIKGNFVGIGVEIVASNGHVKVERVIPDSPAARAGVRRGDVFIAINDTSTENFVLDQVSQLLRGEAGSEVRLQLKNGEEPARMISVTRTDIVTNSVEEAVLLEGTDAVGYIRLRSFQDQTATELNQAIQKLSDAGMRKLVIDLRNNPGGTMRAALKSIELFVQNGQIIMHTKSLGRTQTYRSETAQHWDMPLEVLVNASSASSSEIFAGCLQDLGRCKIIGSRTYGKGVIQRMFRVEDSPFTVKLTTSMFYSPSGKSYHHVGVMPNYQVVQVNHPEWSANVESSQNEPTPPVLREAPVGARVGSSLFARVNDSDATLSSAVRRFENREE